MPAAVRRFAAPGALLSIPAVRRAWRPAAMRRDQGDPRRDKTRRGEPPRQDAARRAPPRREAARRAPPRRDAAGPPRATSPATEAATPRDPVRAAATSRLSPDPPIGLFGSREIGQRRSAAEFRIGFSGLIGLG